MWNFHPYMGPNQAGDTKKCPLGFEDLVQKVTNRTDRPVIITEFGQGFQFNTLTLTPTLTNNPDCLGCQPTDGPAESCPGTYQGIKMGYDETILTIATKYGLSWLPWAWRPMALGVNNKTCQDVNGALNGTALYNPGEDQRGASFLQLFDKFAAAGLPPSPSPPSPPTPSPPSPSPPPGCPGGTLTACLALCPSNPAAAYQACVAACGKRCA